jgi:hypothetical protein
MQRASKITMIAPAVFLVLVLMVPRIAQAAPDETWPNEIWEVLRGFEIVDNSLLQLDEHYILALFHNPETEVFALVLFNVDCEGNACRVNRGAGYSLYSGGVNFFTHVDPRDQAPAFGGKTANAPENRSRKDAIHI